MLFAVVPKQSLKYWDDACPEYSNYFYSPANAGIPSGLAPDFRTPTDCHWQEASTTTLHLTSVIISPNPAIAAVRLCCTQAMVGSSGILPVSFDFRACAVSYCVRILRWKHGLPRKRNEFAGLQKQEGCLCQ